METPEKDPGFLPKKIMEIPGGKYDAPKIVSPAQEKTISSSRLDLDGLFLYSFTPVYYLVRDSHNSPLIDFPLDKQFLEDIKTQTPVYSLHTHEPWLCQLDGTLVKAMAVELTTAFVTWVRTQAFHYKDALYECWWSMDIHSVDIGMRGKQVSMFLVLPYNDDFRCSVTQYSSGKVRVELVNKKEEADGRPD